MSLVFAAITAGILIAVIVLATGRDHYGRSERRGAADYHAKRRLLIQRIERLSGRIERIAATLAQAHPAGESLGNLERLVASFELIVVAFARLSPFGTDPEQLESAEFLVADCEGRAAGLEVRLGLRTMAAVIRVARLIRKGILQAANKFGPVGAPPDRGCYFCSRPFHLELQNFSQVRVRIEGVTRDVFSCGPCKDNLEETKKVKVLYFLSDGKPTHWSRVPGYEPTESFWDINRRVSGLRLITSGPDGVD